MRTVAERRLRIARLGIARLVGRDVTYAARHRERSQLLARHLPSGGPARHTAPLAYGVRQP